MYSKHTNFSTKSLSGIKRIYGAFIDVLALSGFLIVLLLLIVAYFPSLARWIELLGTK